MTPKFQAIIKSERVRRLKFLEGVPEYPDHPLAERTRTWALAGLAVLDQYEAGANLERFTSIAKKSNSVNSPARTSGDEKEGRDRFALGPAPRYLSDSFTQ